MSLALRFPIESVAKVGEDQEHDSGAGVVESIELRAMIAAIAAIAREQRNAERGNTGHFAQDHLRPIFAVVREQEGRDGEKRPNEDGLGGTRLVIGSAD